MLAALIQLLVQCVKDLDGKLQQVHLVGRYRLVCRDGWACATLCIRRHDAVRDSQ